MLTVNSGNAPRLILPDLADNCSLREAEAKLISMGFKLGPTQYVTGERDWVYEVRSKGRTIIAGSRVNIEDPITLVVGNGTYYDGDIEEQDQVVIDSSMVEEDFSDL